MKLLLNTNIEQQTKSKIKGHVARIGGTVNHELINYSICKIKDINIIDGGCGYVKKISHIRSIRNLAGTIKRFLEQEMKHFRDGDIIPLDRKTIILDLHDAYRQKNLKHKYDASISSNVIEHVTNPILFMLNFYFITKKDGYQFHALPHYKYTYDKHRNPTPLSHIIEDFETMKDTEDRTHVDDYISNGLAKSDWLKNYHKKVPISYPFFHHHVFDENNTKALFDFMFEEVTNDIYIDEKNQDNVVIFKNKLKNSFVEKYKDLINKYSPNFLG